jgi:hypothetical protein
MGSMNRSAAFALAAALIAFAALARVACGRKAALVAAPIPAPVAAPAAAPVAAPARKPASARKKIAAVPVAPAKVRGAALRDPGEAFGGTPPRRVDASTSSAQ